MKRKLFYLVFFGVLLVVASNASAITVAWDGGGGADRSYTTPANWDNTDHLPLLTDNVSIYKPVNSPGTACIVNTLTAVGLTVRVGGDSWANAPVGPKPATLWIVDGGKLTTAECFMVGPESTGNRSGILQMTGGNVITGSVNPNNAHFFVGFGHGAIPSDRYVKGEAYISGGQLDVAGNFALAYNPYTIAVVELSGNALINANGFSMCNGGTNSTASLDLRENAKIVINGDKSAIVQGYKDNGWINNEVQISLTMNPGKTTLFVPEPATVCLLGLGVLSLIRRKK